MRMLLFAGLICLLETWGFALPIPHRSLRQLIGDAELIAVAKVKKKESVEGKGRDSGSKATLAVDSLLKGTIIHPDVEVMFFPNVICPSPPRYDIGRTTVVFLRSFRGKYFTCSRSYGSKIVSDTQAKGFALLVRKHIAVQKIKDVKLREKAMSRWLMDCIRFHPARFDGLIDLDNPITGHQSQPNENGPQYWRFLSRKDLVELTDLLKKMRPTEYGYIHGEKHILSIVAKRTGDRELMELYDQFASLGWQDSGRVSEEKKLIGQFLERIEGIRKGD